MLKKISLFLLVLLNTLILGSDQIFGLKNSYDIEIEIDGSDQRSIKKGMRDGLSSLFISLSGNSLILKEPVVKKALATPENFINQYKLEVQNEKLISIFSFQGKTLRFFFSENRLPLWVSTEPIILSFLPCKHITDSLTNREEKFMCDSLEKDLIEISSTRNSRVTHPLMDLKDINYFDSLNSISVSRFMEKISKRYFTSSWLTCFTRDSFGILLDSPVCKSSVNTNFRPLKETFNDLLNDINFDESFVVDHSERNKTLLRMVGVSSFSSLQKLINDLNSQFLVYESLITEIEGDAVLVSVSHYGRNIELSNLLKKNSRFEAIELQSEDIISFKYKNI